MNRRLTRQRTRSVSEKNVRIILVLFFWNSEKVTFFWLTAVHNGIFLLPLLINASLMGTLLRNGFHIDLPLLFSSKRFHYYWKITGFRLGLILILPSYSTTKRLQEEADAFTRFIQIAIAFCDAFSGKSSRLTEESRDK